MDSKRKKHLPERKNRGNRMAELEKNEEKMMEDDKYGIFKEDSSDDDFNPNDEKNINDSSENFENEEKEESIIEPIIKTRRGEKENIIRIKKENEIVDIEQLDIDKIDFIEDLRERGIDVSDEEALKNAEISYNESYDESDKEYNKKKKKDKKGKKNKKKKKVKDDNILPVDKILIENSESNLNYYDSIDNEIEKDLSGRKRTRNENKLIGLFKRVKRDKNNKNVSVVGSKQNPRAIVISKKIYDPNDEYQERKNEKEVEKNANAISFNLEQEIDTKNIIQKFKQQEREKKQFGIQEKIISQEQRLFESIFTEWSNKKSLLTMQKLEDLNKRETSYSNKKSLTDFVKIINSEKHIVEKQLEEKKNNNKENIDNIKENEDREINKVRVTFSNKEQYNKIFSFFNKKPKELKEPKLCAITGKPAKYYDPLTKSYYSSINAFKLLRERYFQKEEDGLLFRIQTLSDLASQKKERLKKMILIDDSNNPINNSNINNYNNNSLQQIKQSIKDSAILNIVNKYGILRKEGGDFEKKSIIHRVYNRNRENCVESGMLLEANKIKLIISKKIFKDKYSSKLPSNVDDNIKLKDDNEV